jgi:hypothetical protein
MSISTCPACGGSLASSEYLCPACGKTLNGCAKHLEPMVLTPELLEWAKQQFNDEDMIAGVEEIQRTGGKELHEFIHELEAEAAHRE